MPALPVPFGALPQCLSLFMLCFLFWLFHAMPKAGPTNGASARNRLYRCQPGFCAALNPPRRSQYVHQVSQDPSTKVTNREPFGIR